MAANCYLLSNPLKPLISPPPSHFHLPLTHPPSRLHCLRSVSDSTPEPQPVYSSVKAFAPATVANLGPGFDFLGCAVDGLGDHVSLRVDPSVRPGEIRIADISGAPKLSKNPQWNCAGIAAAAAMRMLGVRSVGLSLSLDKGLPLGSGLGSSAASAAAAAAAVNELFGGRLTERELVEAGLESEGKVSGHHADNIAPAVMGGFVMITNYEPLTLKRLEPPPQSEAIFVLVSPEFEAPTKKMRAALDPHVPQDLHIWNCSQAGALVASLLLGDLPAMGEAMSSDRIVEPRRGPLIPGFFAVKEAAILAGAFGCTISGAGPTIVALTDDADKGREIGERMVDAFRRAGNLKAVSVVSTLDRVGARLINAVPLP